MFCQIQPNLELRHIDISVHVYMFSSSSHSKTTSTVIVKLMNIDLESIYHEMILYRLQTM